MLKAKLTRSHAELPSFDPKLPVRVRMAFLNGQKIITGTLPFDAVIPAEDWVIRLKFKSRTYMATS